MNKRSGLLLCLLMTCSCAWAAEEGVKVISPDRFHLEAGDLSIGLSQDWRQPLPQVTRALIIVHGRLRNAQTYLKSGEDAAQSAGQSTNTLVIAPQFLNESDVKRNQLNTQVLRWHGNDWMAGEPSIGPGQVSSYGALDQIIKHLGNHKLFPALKEIVVAGHSGGGQVVQRFALTGHDHPTLKTEGISLRYVVANPSSYAYFSPQRPVKFDVAIAQEVDLAVVASCRTFGVHPRVFFVVDGAEIEQRLIKLGQAGKAVRAQVEVVKLKVHVVPL